MKRVLFGGAVVLAAFTLLVQSAAAQRQPKLMAVQSRGGWTRTTPRLPTDVPAVTTQNLMVYVVTNGVQFGTGGLTQWSVCADRSNRAFPVPALPGSASAGSVASGSGGQIGALPETESSNPAK